jgi:hypothetical protein
LLAYEAYLQYLTIIRQVKSPLALELEPAAEPCNSVLQVIEDASELIQGLSTATSWRADKALWTENNIPEILYAFERPKRWLTPKELREPLLKRYKVNGLDLRDIPVLPDHISPLEGWGHVAWTRLEPRILSNDILDRIGDI